MVLMGAAGVEFPITEGLDAIWGYQPSVEIMRRIMDYFAYSRELVSDELAEVRYQARQRSTRLHTLIERSELHGFGRCGHWTQIEWAAEFNQLLVRFLGRPDRQG